MIPKARRTARRTATPAAILCAALWPAGPAAAAGAFEPPAGCTTWLTVQYRSCKVSNYYKCAADRPGDQWRADFGANGPNFRSRIDYETQWVESHNSDGTVDLLQEPAPDPASFSELLATGTDTYEFTTVNSDGWSETMTGYDTLPGQTVVIDGVTLERTKYEIEARYNDGGFSFRARGNEFIHREWRMFLSGTGQTDLGDGFLPQDFSPVEFHFPGDQGFGETVPKYDCDELTASAGAGVVPVSLPRASAGELP